MLGCYRESLFLRQRNSQLRALDRTSELRLTMKGFSHQQISPSISTRLFAFSLIPRSLLVLYHIRLGYPHCRRQ